MKELYILFILTLIYTNIFGQTITVENKCADATTVTVNVDIASFTNVKGFQFFINYDNTIINNPVIGNKASLPSGIEQANTTTTQVRFVWAAFPSTPHTIADGTLFTVTFDVIGSNGDVSALTITNHSLTDANNMSVTPTIVDGAVTVAASCALPIELTAFNAQAQEKMVQLSWATASEINNSHFGIERSIDGETWENIGRVEGNGTTNTEQYYNYWDENPHNTLNYYRLKQVDFDGKYEYSEIRSVFISNENIAIFAYPNPTIDYLSFNDLTKGSIIIYNILGQKVANYSIHEAEQQIDIRILEKGQYFIKILSEKNQIIGYQKIIKK